MSKVSTILSVIGTISGIILLILMFTVYMPQSNERLDKSTEKLENASLDVIDSCDRLKTRQRQMILEYGSGTEEFSYFMSINRENFKSCDEGIRSIKESCEQWFGGLKESYVCNDPRLEHLP